MTAARILHIRFEGRSVDIPLNDLDVGPGSTDNAVKQAVAHYLDVNLAKFTNYIIDRHDTGNMTLRPEAVFG